MQSGGGVKTRHQHFKRFVWVCVGVCLGRKTTVQITLLFLLPPSPASSPHTHWTWYKYVVRDEASGWGRGGELCVKCLLEMHCGVFSCMGNRLCQAFPHFPYLSHLVSGLCFQLCVILFASCTKLIFFPQSLKTELTWLGCCVFLLNSSLNLS